MEPALFVLVFNSYRFEVFRFEDLPAIETFDIVDAVPARDHLRSLVVTGGLHKKETKIRPILMIQIDLSRDGGYFALQIVVSARILHFGKYLEARGPRFPMHYKPFLLFCRCL
jgi:hypothetical protein